MPNWANLLKEINSLGSQYDILRRKYIKQLSVYTGRNVICYYSGWLQKPEMGSASAVNDNDKNGLMTTINGLDVTKGLDLIIHTPGGDTAATESIVDYIWQKFGGDVRCFVPQMAMSAGTMIACSCKEIWMGKQSSLGPVDPQYGHIPAHGVLEEFKKAYDEILNDPRTIPIWQPVIAKYNPAFIGECEKAVAWSTSLVREWLARNMFKGIRNKDKIINAIVTELIDHSVSFAHNRHLSKDKCAEMGLIIKELESDQQLQDMVLSIHHIYCHTLSSTAAFKIIENNLDVAYIQQAQIIKPNGAAQLSLPQITPVPEEFIPVPVIELPVQKPIEPPLQAINQSSFSKFISYLRSFFSK